MKKKKQLLIYSGAHITHANFYAVKTATTTPTTTTKFLHTVLKNPKSKFAVKAPNLLNFNFKPCFPHCYVSPQIKSYEYKKVTEKKLRQV